MSDWIFPDVRKAMYGSDGWASNKTQNLFITTNENITVRQNPEAILLVPKGQVSIDTQSNIKALSVDCEYTTWITVSDSYCQSYIAITPIISADQDIILPTRLSGINLLSASFKINYIQTHYSYDSTGNITGAWDETHTHHFNIDPYSEPRFDYYDGNTAYYYLGDYNNLPDRTIFGGPDGKTECTEFNLSIDGNVKLQESTNESNRSGFITITYVKG